MSVLGWILLPAGLLLIAVAVCMGILIALGKMTESMQAAAANWEDKGFSANSFTALVFFGGLVLVVLSLVFGRAGDPSAATAPLRDPIKASAPARATVTVTQTRLGSSTTATSSTVTGSSSEPSPANPSSAGPSIPTSAASSPAKSGPWSGSTDNLQLVVERVYTDPGHTTLRALSIRVENSSDTYVDFGLDHFLAIDDHGNHYSADENLSTWNSTYLESGQRLAGQIVLSTALRPEATELDVSFNVSTDGGNSFETVRTTVPVSR